MRLVFLYFLNAEKLDLLSTVWYHGLLKQKDAENQLEKCEGNACFYLVRESKGFLHLSAKAFDMCHHLTISQSFQGYTLEGHPNIYETLEELIDHHKSYPVYSDSREFLLQEPCYKGN